MFQANHNHICIKFSSPVLGCCVSVSVLQEWLFILWSSNQETHNTRVGLQEVLKMAGKHQGRSQHQVHASGT